MTNQADQPEPPEAPRRGVRDLLQAAKQSISTGGGPRETLGLFCEALLEAGVPALIVFISFFYATQLSDYRVGKLAALHVLAGLLAGLWLLRSALQGHWFFETLPCYRPLLVYLGLSLLSLALAYNRLQGLETLLTQVWLLGLCLLAMHHFRDPSAAALTLWTAAMCGLVVALLGILQYNGIHLVPTVYHDLPVSTLGNPNFVAHYLILLVPLVLALLAVRRRRWERLLLWAALALALAHLLVSVSRAGWLALLAALAYWFWPQLARLGLRLQQLLIGGLVALLLSAPLGLVLDGLPSGGGQTLGGTVTHFAKNTWDRALSSFDRGNFSVAQRLIIWGDTLDLIRANPVLGVGPGNFELALPAYRNPERHRAWKELMGERTNVAYEAENEYLEFAAEGGLPGLAAMLWLLGALLWSGWQRLRHQPDPALRALTRGCLAGLIATLVHSLFSFNLQDPASAALFWLFGGLVVALNASPSGGQVLRLASPGRRATTLALGSLLAAGGIYLGLCIAAGDYYYSKGRKLQAAGQPNRASLAYDQAIAWRGWDFRYYHSLGLAHIEGRRPAEAEKALRLSLQHHPQNAAALRLLGQAFLLQDNKAEQAVVAARRGAELDPLNVQSHQWLGRALQQAEDYPGSVAAWEEARGLRPGDPETLMGLGIAYRSAGQLGQAVASLEEAALLQPGNPTVLGNLGAVYLMAQRHEQAEPLLRKSMAAEPAQLSWQRNLLVLLVRQQRTAEALELAVPLLQANPGDEQVQSLVRNLRQRTQKEGP